MSIPEWPGKPSRPTTARNHRLHGSSDPTDRMPDTAGSLPEGNGTVELQAERSEHTLNRSAEQTHHSLDIPNTSSYSSSNREQFDTSGKRRSATSPRSNVSAYSTPGFEKESVETIVRKSAESDRKDAVLEDMSLVEGAADSSMVKSSDERPFPIKRSSQASVSHLKTRSVSLKADEDTNDEEIVRRSSIAHQTSIDQSGNTVGDKATSINHQAATDTKHPEMRSSLPSKTASAEAVAPQQRTARGGSAPPPGDEHARGDFTRPEKSSAISLIRKQFDRGFPPGGEASTFRDNAPTDAEVVGRAAPQTPSRTADPAGNRARILEPYIKKQRSPLLSMASAAPNEDQHYTLKAELASAETEPRGSSSSPNAGLLDRIFPRGARTLLAKLQNPADLEGLAVGMERLERQERLLSALRLAEELERTQFSSAKHLPAGHSGQSRQPAPARPTRSATARRRLVWLQPSYRLPPTRPPELGLGRAQQALQGALEAALRGVTYSRSWAADVCRVIAAFVTQEIKALGFLRYKTGCLVRIIEKQHQRLSTSMAVLWDSSNDSYCQAYYEEGTFLAHAVLFVVYVD